MNELAEIIDPDTVIFTTFGKGHLEGFKNIDTIVSEKALLAKNASTVYINPDNHYASRLIDEYLRMGKKVIPFGFQNPLTTQLCLLDFRLEPTDGVSFFQCRCGSTIFSFQAPIFSPEVAVMLLPVFHQALSLGISLDEIRKALNEINLPQGREKIYHIGNGFLIDDSYNANPVSLHKALNLLEEFHRRGYKTWVVLGDMLEMGEFTDTVHQECIHLLEAHHIENVILFGSIFHEAAEKVLSEKPLNGEYYLASSREEIKKILNNQISFPFDQLVILFKGSRVMKLEEAIPMEWIEYASCSRS